jgi:hypothetical protein
LFFVSLVGFYDVTYSFHDGRDCSLVCKIRFNSELSVTK